MKLSVKDFYCKCEQILKKTVDLFRFTTKKVLNIKLNFFAV